MHAQEYIDLVKSTLDALDPKSLELVDLGLPHLMPRGIS